MSYERLTPHDLIETINMPTNGDLTRFIGYAMRLHELENQIEKGEYRKPICKIGDTVYLVKYLTCAGQEPIEIFEEWTIDRISISKLGTVFCGTHLGTNDHRAFSDYEYKDEWFTDKTEAENRLKELKGELK